ncbi:hypothetical protein W97_01783 [Coniosporium apollinis CBS 100218]|uniref:SWR1-complex protein 3 domain-containing protein n=1 Tax=Coniosporium apollinis (strain CBS 100218) TaxID=1168221 RepID=R7YL66_CONA1|nr:uncharacterized protein W97_01783 [Coniosporium apollinis CBS 100218]EON62559.1 hypothetical protein W97_01783 [Coniosporium apollinis CBS 100218]
MSLAESRPRRASTRMKAELAETPAKRKHPTPTKETPKQRPKEQKKQKVITTPRTDDVPTTPRETLPSKIADGKPLPTLQEPQRLDMPIKDYQTIAESGVLQAALDRSRKKWMTDAFGLYWTQPPASNTKPSQRTDKEKEQLKKAKKDAKEQAKRLLRIGACQLTIEPHIFDVTLYTIRDDPPPLPRLPTGAQRPVLHYAPPAYRTQTPQYSTPYQYNAPFQPPNDSLTLPPIRPPTPQQQAPTVTHHAPPPANGGPESSSRSQTTSSTPAQGPAPDPVIHALAQRASTDNQLKQVMQIVAQGRATEAQLQYFQSHINQLTVQLEARKNDKAPSTAPSTAPQIKPEVGASPSPAPFPPTQPSPAFKNGPQAPPPDPTNTQTPTHPYRQQAPNPQPPGSFPPVQKAPPPPPRKQDAKPVLIEFTSNGDKFLFPKHSIIEFLPGSKSMLASFLLIHRHSKNGSGSKPSSTPSTPASAFSPSPAPQGPSREELTAADSWQPVTASLYAEDPGVLQWVARAVLPVEEVVEWMEDVMDRATAAGEGYLALRLPRGRGGDASQDVEMGDT